MTQPATAKTGTASSPRPTPDKRVIALRRFAISITVFGIVGRLFLGFEQSWLQWGVSLAAGYSFELILETINARLHGRRAGYAGGPGKLAIFLLPAHISATAVAMLIYPGSRLWPFILAAAISSGSKYLFRAPVKGRWRHFMNPSNLAIATLLTMYTWVGPAPPYHFTEATSGWGDWVIPAILLASGLLLNIKLTAKLPLILAWVGGFIAQALARDILLGDRAPAILSVVVGTAFILFTNYMITDPGTTPTRPRNQVVFGLTTAAIYGLLAAGGVTFGLFYSLVITCAIRGIVLWAVHLRSLLNTRRQSRAAAAEKEALHEPEPTDTPSLAPVPVLQTRVSTPGTAHPSAG
ncbi:enediyne biosynthesis protein UnbU [Actinomycetota bacterium]